MSLNQRLLPISHSHGSNKEYFRNIFESCCNSYNIFTNNCEKHERLGLEQNAKKKCCRNELIVCTCHSLAKLHFIKKKSSLKSLKFFCFQKSRLVLQLLVFTEITTIKVNAEAIIKFALNHACCLISNTCFSCTRCDRWSLFCSPIFISLFGTNILKVYVQ